MTVAVTALFLVALALLALAPLAGAKEVINYFGTESYDPTAVIADAEAGGFAGGFNLQRDIAVNSSGVGAPQGTIYVADDVNHRVQRFDRNARFVSTWGKDVIASSVNERQRLVIDATGGTFQLTFDGVTTAPIDVTSLAPQGFSNPAAALDNILDDLASVGGEANVAVLGDGTPSNPFMITFQGALAGRDFPQMTVNTSNLQGTARITTLADGTSTTSSTGAAFEICAVATECKAGVASGGDGTTAGNGTLDNPQSVAVDNDTGNVYVSDRDNRRVSVYDASGNFISSYGWNVVNTGSNNASEFQRVTVDATSGTFTLSFGAGAPTVTDPLDFNASAATIQSRLEALGDIGAGNVRVSGPNGGPWVVRFVGALSNTNVALLGSASIDLAGDNPNVAGAGPTVITAEVLAGAQAVNYEICPASNVCQAGSSGAGAGQYAAGTQAGGYGIAVSQPDGNASTGTIFLANTSSTAAQRRVNTYSLDGTVFGSIGSSTEFASQYPRRVAVDSRSILYASDGNNAEEVDRFDTQNVHGGGVGSLLASIPASVNEVQRFTLTNLISTDTYRLTCPDGAQTAEIVRSSGAGVTNNPRDALAAACGADNFIIAGCNTGSSPTTCTVTWIGTFGGRDVPEMSCLIVSSASGSCNVTTSTAGRASALFPGTTLGLAIDPDSDGGGSDEDALYALRGFSLAGAGSDGRSVVQQFGPVNDPGSSASPTVADAIHAAAAGFRGNATLGLGLDDVGGRLYVSSQRDIAPRIGSNGNAHRVYILDDPLPDPAMILSPVTVKTDTTATFSGQVDPKGGLIKCAFEYATDPGFTSPVEVAATGCGAHTPDGGFQAVSQRVTGLTPATHYFLRLKVTRAFDSSAVVTSAPIQFDTDSVPPAISDVGAVQVADTSARLVGTIDPKNSATGYVFQYGTTPALGQSTAPINIGGGARPITVSQLVGGLARDTGYFFRLVATNGSGTTNSATKQLHTRADSPPPVNPPGGCANEALRQAQNATHLPDCRAYEMVSPSDKNQGSVGGRGNQTGEAPYPTFSRDGEALAFCGTASFGEPSGQISLTCAPYISRRGSNGWRTANPLPRFCASDPFTGNAGVFVGPRNTLLAAESFDRFAMATPEYEGCAFFPLVPGAPGDSSNIYRGDLSSDPTGFELLTPNRAGVVTNTRAWPMGGSDDLSHVVYATWYNQTADSPAQGDYFKLYDWEEEGNGDCNAVHPDYDAGLGGCLSLVSKDPGGAAFAADSRLPAYNRGAASVPIPSAVSVDGERIYFQSPTTGDSIGVGRCNTAACNLYLREGGATIEVSASECTSPCGVESGSDNFVWAPPSGQIAIFQSCARLTDASAAGNTCNEGASTTSNLKLYRWDGSQSVGSRLIDLTVDNEPADGSQPQALDIVGASTDEAAAPNSDAAPGNTIYFIAAGQIVAGAPTHGDRKLYRWRWNGGDPRVDYLAPYRSVWADGTVNSVNLQNDPNADRNHERVTPDGRYLVLQTVLPLDPAADRDSDHDIYRWDERGDWLCVSCQMPGTPSAGHASSYTPDTQINALYSELGPQVPEHRISEDGKRIFFSTPDALAPQDVNGETGCPARKYGGADSTAYDCADIYQWHDGTLSLTTSGAGTRPFFLIGATADAERVFFSTAQRLVGWDLDTQMDIYAAPVNGGFPEPPPAPPSCDLEAGGCEGPPSVAQSFGGAGSRAFEGRGNPRAFFPENCGPASRKAKRKFAAAKKAARKGQVKRARALRKQARNLNRRAKRCNRRNAR